MSNGFKYDGSARFYGVPARDLTQAEFEALGPREQRTVRDSPAYTAKGGTPPKREMKSETKPEPTTATKPEAADSKDGA